MSKLSARLRRAAAQGGCQLECTVTGPPAAGAGAAVNFTSTATAAACAGAVNYEWDFGATTPRYRSERNVYLRRAGLHQIGSDQPAIAAFIGRTRRG